MGSQDPIGGVWGPYEQEDGIWVLRSKLEGIGGQHCSTRRDLGSLFSTGTMGWPTGTPKGTQGVPVPHKWGFGVLANNRMGFGVFVPNWKGFGGLQNEFGVNTSLLEGIWGLCSQLELWAGQWGPQKEQMGSQFPIRGFWGPQ